MSHKVSTYMIKRYTKLRRLIVGVVALTALSSSAYNASHYAKSSLLSTGHWAKIKVTNSGMQEITYDQLVKWGFSDPSKVTVFGYGGVAAATENFVDNFPDDLCQQPVVHTGDKIVFYGEAEARPNIYFSASLTQQPLPCIERNYAADAGYYLITDSRDSYEAPVNSYSPSTSATATTHVYHKSPGFFEEELQNYGNAGQLMVGRDISDGTQIDLSFRCPDRYINNSELTKDFIEATILMAAVGDKPMFTFEYPTNSDGKLKTTTYSFTLGSSPHKPTVEYSNHLQPIQAILKGVELENDIVPFKFYKSTSASCNMQKGALDYFAYYYHRNNNLPEGTNSLLMLYDDVAAGNKIKINNITDRIHVWNVTYAYDVVPYEVYIDNDGNGYISAEKKYSINAGNPSLRLMVFNPDEKQNSVEFVNDIANQDIHSLDTPDMLIISSDLLYDYAEKLADLHRQIQGMDVVVLRQDEIFNEFGSGTPSTSSIRRLAKMFYDRNSNKFKNLLLFGGGSYDNRGITTHAKAFKSEGALLLTYGTTEHQYQKDDTRSFTSDCYFGMLNDNFNISNLIYEPMQINVGRIPARNIIHARDVLTKIESHLTNLPSVDIFHRAVIAADNGDTNSHMINAENFAATLENSIGGMTTVKAYVSLYPLIRNESPTLRDAINQSFSMGTGLFGFSGHGSSSSFTAENIMNLNLIKRTEYDFYPMAILATCDSYGFDRLVDNIAETMVFAPKGGMIGVVGSGRTVYADRNQKLFEVIARIYGNAGEGALTGDIMRKARNSILNENSGDKNLAENTLTYNYCGDPALPLYYAPATTTIEKINGQALSAGSVTLQPCSTATIEGYISKNGTVNTDFNGSVVLSLYETPRVLNSTVHPGSGDSSIPVSLDEDLMCQTVANVVNGRFTAEFTVPVPIRDGQYNRLTSYAFTSDLKSFSSNWTDRVKVDINAEYAENADTEGPHIAGLWINSKDFSSGDAVNPDFTVLAHIEADESGLRVSTGNIGANSRLVIDEIGSIALMGTSMTYNTDGSVDISWPVSGVAEGRHTLTLKCADNLGNLSSRSVAFTVVNNNGNAKLSVAEKTGHTEFNFTLDHPFTVSPKGRIVIENLKGEKVHVIDNVTFDGEITWDLCDSNNKLIADGVYRAYAVASNETATAMSEPIELVIIQKQ